MDRFSPKIEIINHFDNLINRVDIDIDFCLKQYTEESFQAIDYLNQIRMRTIEELKKEQEETLEKYKLNSARFKSELSEGKSIEELRKELFDEKFYFQVKTKQQIWAFSLFTLVTDFYMSQSDIELLE